MQEVFRILFYLLLTNSPMLVMLIVLSAQASFSKKDCFRLSALEPVMSIRKLTVYVVSALFICA